MRNRLIYKFIAVYLVIALLAFILISTLGSDLVEAVLVRVEGQNLYNTAVRIAASSSLRTPSDDARLEKIEESLTSIGLGLNADITLISSDGQIYLNTASDSIKSAKEELPAFDPIALGSSYYTTGNFFGHYETDHLSVIAPIASNLKIQGYVAIHRELDSVYRMRENILAVLHLLFWILFSLFLLVFLMLALTVLRPLRKITEGTRRFISGDLSYDIPVRTHDELGALSSSLNYMSSELNKSGEYQQRFIADVSHDFRSPLTSIRGYLEAMLDGTIPFENQERYLRILLAETERLTKLTNGILSLNRMDQGASHLHRTAFDLHTLIRDTALTFEGSCRSRKIAISLTLSSDICQVFADPDKIQQVLYNLIDNAVKFSPDESTIEIDTEVRRDKVYISVKDHGSGIPSASLSKIWTRFYKSDASRGRERKGNGLGLAIVKEIMKEHRENITVVSTEGVGSEFIFSLPLQEES